MKALFILFCVSVHSLAQGTILFSNRNLADPRTGALYDAPVSLPNGTRAEGGAFTAGLFVVEGDQLRLVHSRQFRTGIGAGFFLQDPNPIEIGGVAPGSPATFRVRVWETSAGSYDNAVANQMLRGEFATGQPENNLSVPYVGPPPANALPEANLSGIQPLTLVPEPTVTAMFVGGGIIWVAAWRRFRWDPAMVEEASMKNLLPSLFAVILVALIEYSGHAGNRVMFETAAEESIAFRLQGEGEKGSLYTGSEIFISFGCLTNDSVRILLPDEKYFLEFNLLDSDGKSFQKSRFASDIGSHFSKLTDSR
jgi:hypothetical protein